MPGHAPRIGGFLPSRNPLDARFAGDDVADDPGGDIALLGEPAAQAPGEAEKFREACRQSETMIAQGYNDPI